MRVFHDLLLLLNCQAWEIGIIATPMEAAIGAFQVRYVGDGGTIAYQNEGN